MKKVLKNKIINIEQTDKFDNKFNFDVLNFDNNQEKINIIYISDLLEKRKNLEMLEKAKTKPASYSNVYSPEDELEIFENLFNNALKNKEKIHIIGITLKEEIDILEDYYRKLGFFNDEMNSFLVDFSKVLVSVSVKIENLMWRGSDYRREGKKIFFNPPIRESGQVKAMFKGINRGVIAGIYIKDFLDNKIGDFNDILSFFRKQILEEKILSIYLAKILYYNLIDFGITGKKHEMILDFNKKDL